MSGGDTDTDTSIHTFEIHVFCDASTLACGTVLYFRGGTRDKIIHYLIINHLSVSYFLNCNVGKLLLHSLQIKCHIDFEICMTL